MTKKPWETTSSAATSNSPRANRNPVDTVEGKGVTSGMACRGRWVDNVLIWRLWRAPKHENTPHAYEDLNRASEGIAARYATTVAASTRSWGVAPRTACTLAQRRDPLGQCDARVQQSSPRGPAHEDTRGHQFPRPGHGVQLKPTKEMM